MAGTAFLDLLDGILTVRTKFLDGFSARNVAV